MGRTIIPSIIRLAAAFTLWFTGACAVGPDYARPQLQAPGAWHSELKGGLTARQPDPTGLAEWWNTLHDPILSNLVRRAVDGNLDLKEARARIREARARRGISRADRFPTLDVEGSGTGSRTREHGGDNAKTYRYAAGFDAGWELDIFGGVRRAVEAADADLSASQEDFRDVLVSLLAEVALNYVEVRTYQARLVTAEANLSAQEETYNIAQWRFQAGLTTQLDVEQARYNLETTRSQIPTLRSGLEAAKNRIAVLLGEKPGKAHAGLEQQSPIPVTPIEIAVGVPADVLRRRPDIRRAERRLAAQTARVGEATAELYPRFSLVGSIGLETLSVDRLLYAGARTYSMSIGPSINWPISRAGAIRKNIEVQNALQEQALIQYESALLNALEEVENALTAFAEEQQRRLSLVEATGAAQRATQLAHEKYRAGLIDFSDVLDAQRSLLSLQDQKTQSDGAVTNNLVRLYKALGGGWTSLAPDAGT
jgi:NodT family efflux transporter outer membrane factor (OMF) lipoprotein